MIELISSIVPFLSVLGVIITLVGVVQTFRAARAAEESKRRLRLVSTRQHRLVVDVAGQPPVISTAPDAKEIEL
jgi:hemolysin-activating ACP:hemolysin acyltransferase